MTDPTTTLITFMFQTPASAQSVHLIGSWDNFTKQYPMERDTRRGSDQWRGCYSFDGIICDGDEHKGRTIHSRTGGLKMGSTYYYYYLLDNNSEVHDVSIPSTTSCPYLPGQQVNLLFVPVEIQERVRSASMSSISSDDIKTMDPSHKFMTPRPPPPTPLPARLTNSASAHMRKRSARSVSPRPEKSQWSSRIFFGLRQQTPPPPLEAIKRGRSASLSKLMDGDVKIGLPALISRSDDADAIPDTREDYTRPANTRSREPSPLRHVAGQEVITYTTAQIIIPDEIAEEVEDDDNFASDLDRISLSEECVLSQLSPPPSAIRLASSRIRTATDTSKPLPQLPNEALLDLIPAPLRLRTAATTTELPRSHFSNSTIGTASLTSPTESSFGFSDTPSIYSIDDEIPAAGGSLGEEFTYHSHIIAEATAVGFVRYGLPSGEYESEQTLRKEDSISPLMQAASRTTFGAAVAFAPGGESEDSNPFRDLLSEMGYLGDLIIGK